MKANWVVMMASMLLAGFIGIGCQGDEECTPDCVGKVCGDDNGCEGICTACPAGQFCNATAGACQDEPCLPDCSAKVCGEDDGCGGKCTGCGTGQFCNATAWTCEDSTPAGWWSTTSSLNVPRGFNFTTTALSSGEVLAACGHTTGADFPIVNTSETYSPSTGAWRPSASMATARASVCSVLLPSGKVLVAGGSASPGGLASAELYDPDTNSWAPTTEPMEVAHDLPACALLDSGKVIISGGLNAGGTAPTPVVEIYDPDTGVFTTTGPMATARYWHTATVLASGEVLVTGGCVSAYPCTATTASAENYDPVSGTWSDAGELPAGVFGHVATRLLSDKVLITGGCRNNSSCGPEGGHIGDADRTASLYDPDSGTWSPAGSAGTGRVGHAALLLSSGMVLLAGGAFNAMAGTTTDLFNPETGDWSPGPQMPVDHGTYVGVTKLADGRWLIIGGLGPWTNSTFHVTNASSVFTE